MVEKTFKNLNAILLTLILIVLIGIYFNQVKQNKETKIIHDVITEDNKVL